MNGAEALRPRLDRVQRISIVIGAIALVICFSGALFQRNQFFHSYLMAYLFWTGMTLGCWSIVMLHHLVGGWWGFIIRRPLEAGMATLPLVIVLFIPLLFGLRDLYAWARPEVVAREEHLQHSHLYLNVPFFLGRVALYFIVWFVCIFLLNKWSTEQDRTADVALLRRMQLLSGPGLILYCGTLTFASIDWVMSLEPEWFSTIYGMIYLVGETLLSLSLAITVVMLLRDQQPLARMITPTRFRDLGNLMLTFVMLWAYIQFSQFLIIWAENLTDEIPWFLHRTRGGWGWIASILIVFHFFIPFFLLLSRDVKDRAQRLAAVAAAMLFVRLIDHFWLVEPAFHQRALHIDWMDLAAPIGIGGLWIAAFVWRLKSAPLVPLHDPRLEKLEQESA